MAAMRHLALALASLAILAAAASGAPDPVCTALDDVQPALPPVLDLRGGQAQFCTPGLAADGTLLPADYEMDCFVQIAGGESIVPELAPHTLVAIDVSEFHWRGALNYQCSHKGERGPATFATPYPADFPYGPPAQPVVPAP